GGNGVGEGLRFGMLIGTFSVCTFVFHNYVNLNIGLRLTLIQAVAYFLEWLLVGVVIGAVYNPALFRSARSCQEEWVTRIKWACVLLGGLIAGIIINVFEIFWSGFVLRERWLAAMQAINHPLPAAAMWIFALPM